MLSYLKDSQTQIPAASGTPAETAGTDAALSKQEDYLTVSGHSQKLRQSTILLIVLFGVGMLGVWFMIKKTTPAQGASPAADDQAQLEAAIAQLNGMQSEVNTKMDSVVNRFYQFSNVGQVSVDELKKNPFKLEQGASVAVDEDSQQRNKRMLLEDKVRRAAAGLQLWSVTSTPRGICCMISDKVLYVGDSINGLTVKSIDKKIVELELDGIILQMKMDE
jgi:preprotein translocase subunit SecG